MFKQDQFFCSLLVALHSSLLIFTNLIFQKFILISIVGYEFEISIGVITYILVLLCTNIINELYGINIAKTSINIGVIVSFFISGLIICIKLLPSSDWSPLNDKIYDIIFMNYNSAIIASMMAFYTSQMIDAIIYNFLKLLSVHLLIRNNISAMISLLVDSIIVTIILYWIGIVPIDRMLNIIISEYLCKIYFLLIINPIFYIIIRFIRYKS